MRSAKDGSGQIYTMEGIVASVILLSILLFIIESNSIITPQTEGSVDMKLYEKSVDTLTCLDRNDSDSWSMMPSLKTYVSIWNGPEATLQHNMTGLSQNITSMLPADVLYNLEFIYNTSTCMNDSLVIYNGVPPDNSVTATRLVTLNNADANGSAFWKNMNRAPELVEVKITCWYL